MYIIFYNKNKQIFDTNKNIIIPKKNRFTNPLIKSSSALIKSTIHDYLASVLSTAIFSFAFYIIVLLEFFKNRDAIIDINNQIFFFIYMTIIISFGFSGIIEAIPNKNWKFHAIVSSNKYTYHMKHSILFLVSIIGILFIPLIFIGMSINPLLLVKYLFCILILFFITINISFTTGNILIKMFIFLIFVVLTVWISTLPAVFLSIFIIPAVLFFMKAKNEYKEWLLL